MWNPKLTNEIVFLAKLLLVQSGTTWCDCDTECSCLSIEDIGVDINCIRIKTKDNLYFLKVENTNGCK